MEQNGSLATLLTRLAAHKGKWPDLAVAADVPISTLRKVAQGHTPNPRIETVDRLTRALDAIETEGRFDPPGLESREVRQ